MKNLNSKYDIVAEMLSAHNHCGETDLEKISLRSITDIIIKLVVFITKYGEKIGPFYTKDDVSSFKDRTVVIALCSHCMYTAYNLINEVKFTDRAYTMFQDIADMALQYNILYAILEYNDESVVYRIYTTYDNGSGMTYNTKEEFMNEISAMIDDFIINGGKSFIAEINTDASCFHNDEV